MKEPLIHTGIALALHLILLVVLLGVFKLNIYSVLYANIFFAFIICILNAFSIKKFLHYRQELVKTFIIPLVSSGIMGLTAYGVYNLCHLVMGNAVSCILAILIGMIVYAVLLMKLRGVTERELYGIPKGAVIVEVLKKCRLL
jgi:stage V sporulation protein B